MACTEEAQACICRDPRVRLSAHGCAPVTRLGPRGKAPEATSEPVCRDEQDVATQGNGRASGGTRCEQHGVAEAPDQGARDAGVGRDRRVPR